MFIVLPSFWVVALGWSGMKSGSLMNGLSEGTKSAQAGGGKGAGEIINHVKK
ncbi:conjugal transfer protein TraG, partial [Pseudomonas syringae pv. tagetis]